MRYRRLGWTGLDVSEVGFGGAGIGHVWGETTDAECIRAVHCALDHGINFFDTSPMYGAGRSEANLGAALAGRRGRAIVATKVRLHDEDDLSDLERAVRRSLDESLGRLGTDFVDILQIHHQVGARRGRYLAVADPPRYALLLTAADCLAFAEAAAGLVSEGKVRFLGITAWDGDRVAIRTVLRSGAFATAQVLYNMVNQTAGSPPPTVFDDIDQGRALDAACENDVGVIAIRSHAAGALVDRLDRDVAPDSDVARDHARSRRLSLLTSPACPTLSAVALRFCLDNPTIATVVPGFKSAAEVEEAVSCSDAPPIPDSDRAALDLLYQRGFAG